MNKLAKQDLSWVVTRLPKKLKETMKAAAWEGRVFVGGGFIRAVIGKEEVNDIDLFVQSAREAELLARKIEPDSKMVHKTENAYTIRGKLPIQIIHRWVFDKPEDVSNSFDFTVCCAVVYVKKFENSWTWDSFCDERFYIDLASKRLVYRKPVRNEDAGGSMLRVLKYYQRGYRIPLDSLGDVIARLMTGVEYDAVLAQAHNNNISVESQTAKIITGLLREVDPNIDPTHESHLPAINN